MNNRTVRYRKNAAIKPYEAILIDLCASSENSQLKAPGAFNIVFLLLNIFCDMQEHANIREENSYETRRYFLAHLLNATSLCAEPAHYTNMNYFAHTDKPSTFNIYLDALVYLSTDKQLAETEQAAQDIVDVFFQIICIRHITLMQYSPHSIVSNDEKREIISFDTLLLDERLARCWQAKHFSFFSKVPLSSAPENALALKLGTLLAMPELPIVSQVIETITIKRHYNELKSQQLNFILVIAANRNDDNLMLAQLLTKINPVELYQAVVAKQETNEYQPRSLLERLTEMKHDDTYICICLMAIFGYLVKCYKKTDDDFKQKLTAFTLFCNNLMPLILSRDGFFNCEDTQSSSEEGSICSTSLPISFSELDDPFNTALRQPPKNENALRDVDYRSACEPLVYASPSISGYNGTLMFFSIISLSSETSIAKKLPKPHKKVLEALKQVPIFCENYCR